MKSFSERLQHVAHIREIDQVDIADTLGKNKSAVSKWWNGKITPGTKNMRSLSDLFKCDYSWLLTGQGEPFPDRYTPPAGDAINFNLGKKAPQNNMVSISYIEENYASAGKGIINYDAAKEVMQFDRNFLISQFGPTDFENVHIIHALGDSMTPAIVSGDMLFVNPGEKDIVTGTVYVLVVGEETMVKRVERNPLSGELTLLSDNVKYAPIEILKDDLDKVYVIGRVLGNFKKF